MEFPYNNTESHRAQWAPEHGLIPLSFPKTKVALWNPAPLGDTISLHLAYYRNPKLLVVERTLRLAHRHAKQTERNQFFCFLLGSVVHDVDDEGVALMVDRLDPGREVPGRSEKIPTALLPGDFLIPCIIDARGTTFSDIIVHSAEDFNIAFQMLHCYCCSKETIDHSRLLTMRAHITCIESMDSLRLELHWAAVTVANIFDATPVNPVPIIPTALARNLTSPINIAQVQGTCKFGYLTMDQTRKLLLILESDPKAFTLPLVGIWLSGVIHIQSPQVWASCLRYMFSSSIQERVFSTEQKSFLLVLYSLTHKEPEFYECHPYGEHQKLDFQLLTSTEVINLYKNAESSGKQPIEFELSENQNSESDFFKEVASKIVGNCLQLELPSNKISGGDQDSGVGEEDLSPRPMPSPHPVGQQFPRICPSVPELSIVFDGSFIEPKNSTTKPHQNKAPIMPPKKNATCGNFNLMKPYSENRQPGLVSHGAAPFQKQTCPPSKQSIPSAKSNREMPPPQHTNFQKSRQFVRKTSSSSCSSSSSSTPLSGPSPDSTMDQPKLLSPTNRVEALHNVVLRKGAFPSRGRQSLPNTRQPPSPIKSNRPSLQHTPTFLPHSPVRTSEIPMMGPPPHFPIQYPTHYCNCCQHHGPYCVPSMNANWQGNGLTYGSTGVHSPICHDCNPVVCHQNLGLSPISHYNAVYGNTSPMNQSFQSQVNGSPPKNTNIKSLGNPHASQQNPCKSCTGPSACVPFSGVRMGPDQEANGAMGLPVDAYKMLVEQDRQLKLLQAQIQRLLDTQTCAVRTPAGIPCASTSVGISNLVPQPERQMDFDKMETQTSGIQMRKSVSIAVNTGASLFWCPPDEHQVQQSMSSLKLNDSELSKEDVAIPVAVEDTSITSSLNAVDICSFAESSQETSKQTTADVQNSAREDAENEYNDQVSFQSPVLGESASICLQRCRSDIGNKEVPKTEEHAIEPLANPCLQDEQMFYQHLMGQVNQILQSSPSENQGMDDEVVESEISEVMQTSRSRNKRSKTHTYLKDENDVLSATMKQLKKMGVQIDLETSNSTKKIKNKVENASTLACIHPAAVIPRLNYMSFANVNTSGFGTGAVDLSMEANAIALKYLNDSQLSQIAQSRNDTNDQSHNLLQLNPDKSLVGLSLISPNNMSFATRKYMMRYGLIECDNSSEEEEDSLEAIDQHESVAFRKEKIEKVSEGKKSINKHRSPGSFSEMDRNVLRNISNGIASSKSVNIVEPPIQQESQPYLKSVKPKMKMHVGETYYTQHPEKENGIETLLTSNKIKPISPETPKHSESNSMVGNILDVSRLRQLPKLF
ncbi:SCL-interrupting locus protein homolog [Callorhinchus milii]|uniref:SCL-interrupting locus protein homolog n=1 Tax=Callorhinchus milii TaxID=7868 RepID=UPI001C3FAC6B|nr:SCL-interrupting locus protein homolog [Callorhinchus milii]